MAARAFSYVLAYLRIVIYHADAVRVLPLLSPVDLMLTDPPYGIDAARVRNSQQWGWRDWDVNGWDKERPSDDLMRACLTKSRHAIVWGGNYFLGVLPAKPTNKWLVWDKGQTDFSLADCELAWCSWDGAIRRMVLARGAVQEPRLHPTQKPEEVMRWALTLAPEAQTVLDPFMGSGTTLVACKRLGRACIGIEREERYCELAAQRLSQGALQLTPETTQPSGRSLWEESDGAA